MAVIRVVHNCVSSDSDCLVDLLCGIDTGRAMHIGDTIIPFYAIQYSTPSIKITDGVRTCYAPVISGSLSSRLHVRDASSNAFYATSVRKCKRTFSTTESVSYSTQTNNSSNWTVTIGGTKVSGISYCGNLSATVGSTIDMITVDSVTITNNIHCYCRATSPTLSAWVYNTYFSTAGYTGCYQYCNSACAERIAENASVRAGIINSM